MTDVVERTELIQPWPGLALAGLLGVEAPDLEHGEELPLLWHWLFLLDRPATVDLGPDGHAVRGTIPAPPGPGRRRMYAGGRIRRLGPLRCGEEATRRTRVARSVDKVGRSGPLTVVTVHHEIVQRGAVVVEEEQDLVYRATGPLAVPDPTDEERSAVSDDAWRVETSPTLLFRFSALTYNGHRIHYDDAYAREVEGYPGLVVHGPLQALLMSEAFRRRRPDAVATAFSFRLTAPVFAHEDVAVTVDDPDDRMRGSWSTAVHTGTGRPTASGLLSAAV